MRGRTWMAMWSIGLAAILAACAAPPDPALDTPPDTTTTLPPGAPTTPVGDDSVRLNQIQLIGSHNSYHIAPAPQLLAIIKWVASLAPSIANQFGGDPASLDYTHATINQQLLRGLRTFEFDIWADPEGGRFNNPKMPANFGFQDPLIPGGLDQPGFKVFHTVDVDYRTRCSSLSSCLLAIKSWSDANPGHLPVVLNIELKGSGLPAPLVGTPVLPFDASLLEAVDAEINSVLGDRLITPDSVRGSAPDLRTAVTTTGWPTVADSRGKVLVFMDNADLRDLYLQGHPSLQGRAMFTSSGEGQPDGAVLKVNEPGDGSAIAALVNDGYLVRTRSDADLIEAWNNDTTRREVAFASGAQVIHSDFPQGEPYTNGYVVRFDKPVQARCNPVNTTPSSCTDLALVEPN